MFVDCRRGKDHQTGGQDAAKARANACLAKCAHFNVARAAVFEGLQPEFHHLNESMRHLIRQCARQTVQCNIDLGWGRTYRVILSRVENIAAIRCYFDAIFEGSCIQIRGSGEGDECGGNELRILRVCRMFFGPSFHGHAVLGRDVLEQRDHLLREVHAGAFHLELRVLHQTRQDRKQNSEISHSVVFCNNETVSRLLGKISNESL